MHKIYFALSLERYTLLQLDCPRTDILNKTYKY